jgi:hypothetical protein
MKEVQFERVSKDVASILLAAVRQLGQQLRARLAQLPSQEQIDVSFSIFSR